MKLRVTFQIISFGADLGECVVCEGSNIQYFRAGTVSIFPVAQWPIQGGEKNFSSKKWEMLEKIDYSTYAISWQCRMKLTEWTFTMVSVIARYPVLADDDYLKAQSETFFDVLTSFLSLPGVNDSEITIDFNIDIKNRLSLSLRMRGSPKKIPLSSWLIGLSRALGPPGWTGGQGEPGAKGDRGDPGLPIDELKMTPAL
ncbi:hypothetical protein ACFE04_008316 [Oxalis oulophora]